MIPAAFVNPFTPRNVTAVFYNGGINITWKAPLDVFHHFTHYIVQIKAHNSDWKEVPERVYPPTTSYFTLEFIPSTVYELRVYTVDGEIYSDPSDEVVVSTKSGQFA